MNNSELTNAYREILKNAKSGEEATEQMINRLSGDLKAGIALIDNRGRIAARAGITEKPRLFHDEARDEGLSFSQIYEDLTDIPMEQLPISSDEKKQARGYRAAVFPITVFGERTGSLVVYKAESTTVEENRLCVSAACLIGLIMAAAENARRALEDRKRESVRAVTDSLSYSEIMVSATIFKELKEGEGVIVASRIADKEGITRSVIVNAIRKLESAGILESRSLGMKGTYIKVLNEYFAEEAAKIKK